MNNKTIYIAGGCFWGVEAYYKKLKGIISTKVGYSNGITTDPTYEEVKSQKTLHSECVEIHYDSETISLTKILEHFLRFVDPYSIDKQGHDIGHQYRSGVYFTSSSDEKIIKDYFNKSLKPNYQIEIKKLDNFFNAEEYHQDYLTKNPNGYCHVNLNLIKKDELK